MSATDLSISDAGRALREGRLTARALLEAHLTRIDRLEPQVRAFVHLDRNVSLAAADIADSETAGGRYRGPLHGIPFAVKDLIDVALMPTRCGSRAQQANVPRTSAAIVDLLVAAGAVPLGKVATYEYALTGPSFDGANPPARNPWNVAHVTGGSSSGSAAAVAAGLVRFAIGTDTGGSVRSPAAYCGVVGLKPTRGQLPLDGVFPLSPSLDHVGIICASVADAAIVQSILAPASNANTALDAGARDLSVGYARGWFAEDPAVSPAVVELMDDAVAVLSMLGARISMVALPDYSLAEAAGAVLIHAEALEVHREVLGPHWADYGRQARQSLSAGIALSPTDVARARSHALRFADEVDALLSAHDVIVMPTTLTTAPPLSVSENEESVWTPMRTLPFNLTGHPAMSVPMGFAGGLPLGLQIIGRKGCEVMVCRVGAAFEAATDHAAQRPYLPD
ncbi:MAG: amidase [Rhodobacterales bacterium 32-67-9]|nr:MAG: amidase [Rhodobacterales bacterium 32-67-9]